MHTRIITYPIGIHPRVPFSHDGKFSISTNCKNKKTGASELVAFSNIIRLGIQCIHKDISVVIDGHRYEPDFVYINKEKGIYVDIEVDEPYSANHHPTHYITNDGTHKDHQRNQAFLDAGWYVIRFTEQQMFCQTKECMKLLFDLLVKIGAEDSLPKLLRNAGYPMSTPCYTANEARKLSHRNYRKEYLGYNPIKMDAASHLRCCIGTIHNFV